MFKLVSRLLCLSDKELEIGFGEAVPKTSGLDWLAMASVTGSMMSVASEVSLLWPALWGAFPTPRLATIAAETSFRISSILLRRSTTSSAMVFFMIALKILLNCRFIKYCCLLNKQTTCHRLTLKTPELRF